MDKPSDSDSHGVGSWVRRDSWIGWDEAEDSWRVKRPRVSKGRMTEKSKGGRPSVACVICRAARRACDGKFADCVKYVSLPTTASDAPGPSQPASPPPSRPVRSKVSPGGSEHRGAPVALAAEPAYSPDEKMRDYTDRRYDLKQRRTSEEAVGYSIVFDDVEHCSTSSNTSGEWP